MPPPPPPPLESCTVSRGNGTSTIEAAVVAAAALCWVEEERNEDDSGCRTAGRRRDGKGSRERCCCCSRLSFLDSAQPSRLPPLAAVIPAVPSAAVEVARARLSLAIEPPVREGSQPNRVFSPPLQTATPPPDRRAPTAARADSAGVGRTVATFTDVRACPPPHRLEAAQRDREIDR